MTRPRLLAAALALGFLVSCGKYGPPVRSQPPPAGAASPTQEPASEDPSGTAPDDEQEEQR